MVYTAHTILTCSFCKRFTSSSATLMRSSAALIAKTTPSTLIAKICESLTGGLGGPSKIMYS